MIICLGPICFPIWQLFPVLVLLLAKAKAVYYWMIGKPMPVEDGDNKKIDGPNEAKVAEAGDSGESAAVLRQRRAGGVTSVKSAEDWHSLVKVCAFFRTALSFPPRSKPHQNLGASGRCLGLGRRVPGACPPTPSLERIFFAPLHVLASLFVAGGLHTGALRRL